MLLNYSASSQAQNAASVRCPVRLSVDDESAYDWIGCGDVYFNHPPNQGNTKIRFWRGFSRVKNSFSIRSNYSFTTEPINKNVLSYWFYYFCLQISRLGRYDFLSKALHYLIWQFCLV